MYDITRGKFLTETFFSVLESRDFPDSRSVIAGKQVESFDLVKYM